MTDTILEVTDIYRIFPPSTVPALGGVSFSVQRGECLVISGANGSGKSVLMHLIANLDRCDRGSITIARDAQGREETVGLVFQDAQAQILGDTVLEDVLFGPENRGKNEQEAEEIARTCICRVGLAGKEQLPARSLSGGEKRRLAVAGILAIDPSIIIFDEPYANLDWDGVVGINRVIRDLKKEGRTILILTHELEKVLALAHRLIVLVSGKIVYNGAPDTALSEAPLKSWGIRSPIGSYRQASDLLWMDET